MNELSPPANGSRIPALLLVLILAGFGVGLYYLFSLRFAAGDVFPPYSSLRSDPLGTKALYLALERQPEVAVHRHFRELARLRDGKRKTVILAGTSVSFFAQKDGKEVEELATLAREGNRVIMAFQPVRRGEGCDCPDKEGEEEEEADAPSSPSTGGSGVAPPPVAPGKWGVKPAYEPAGGGKDPVVGQATRMKEAPGLPATLPVRTALFFTATEEGWETVYGVEGRPVVMERPLGKGSIVLVADAYLLSNEALRNERHPGFLSWLAGSDGEIIFDEAHLGVSESPGVMALARKYRFQPFLAGLCLVAVLFVWKSAVPLVPVRDGREPDQRGGEERSHFTGLVNLLRRTISPDRLLGVCYREWQRACGRHYRGVPHLLERMGKVVAAEEAKPAGKRDPVAGYAEITKILAERKRT